MQWGGKILHMVFKHLAYLAISIHTELGAYLGKSEHLSLFSFLTYTPSEDQQSQIPEPSKPGPWNCHHSFSTALTTLPRIYLIRGIWRNTQTLFFLLQKLCWRHCRQMCSAVSQPETRKMSKKPAKICKNHSLQVTWRTMTHGVWQHQLYCKCRRLAGWGTKPFFCLVVGQGDSNSLPATIHLQHL